MTLAPTNPIPLPLALPEPLRASLNLPTARVTVVEDVQGVRLVAVRTDGTRERATVDLDTAAQARGLIDLLYPAMLRLQASEVDL